MYRVCLYLCTCVYVCTWGHVTLRQMGPSLQLLSLRPQVGYVVGRGPSREASEVDTLGAAQPEPRADPQDRSQARGLGAL